MNNNIYKQSIAYDIMKINFSTVLKNLKGVSIKTKDEDGKEIDMDLSFVSSNALLAEFPQQQNQPQEDGRSKQLRANLARKIFNGGVVEVTAEEITKIKERIAKAYGALIVGEAYDILEAAEAPEEEESPKSKK